MIGASGKERERENVGHDGIIKASLTLLAIFTVLYSAPFHFRQEVNQ